MAIKHLMAQRCRVSLVHARSTHSGKWRMRVTERHHRRLGQTPLEQKFIPVRLPVDAPPGPRLGGRPVQRPAIGLTIGRDADELRVGPSGGMKREMLRLDLHDPRVEKLVSISARPARLLPALEGELAEPFVAGKERIIAVEVIQPVGSSVTVLDDLPRRDDHAKMHPAQDRIHRLLGHR